MPWQLWMIVFIIVTTLGMCNYLGIKASSLPPEAKVILLLLLGMAMCICCWPRTPEDDGSEEDTWLE